MREAVGAVGAALGLVAIVMSVSAQESTPAGVNPRDNVTKVELIGKRDTFAGATSIDSVSLKYDRALSKQWGMNLEMPFLRFDAPSLAARGIGDIQVRGRYIDNRGRLAYLAATEIVAPTAANDALGAGKWQVNPVVGVVLSPTHTTFVFAGYKHIWSFAGQSDRADLNQMQPRFLLGFLSPRGWWALGDVKYTRDLKTNTDLLDVEAEVGQMLSRTFGVSVRAGTSYLDSTRNATASINARYLF